LVGRVSFVIRDGRTRRVWGGRWGRLRARLLRLRRRVLPIAGWPYRALRASGMVRRFWRPRITQVRLSTDEGPLTKYLHRGRVVARWWPARGHLWFRKPYDLVIAPPRRVQGKGKGPTQEDSFSQ
jgi:hypothetical protein